MRHIFYIHSHITALVAYSYIREKKINLDDMIIVIGRSFVTEYNFDCAIIRLDQNEQSIEKIPSYGTWNLMKNYFTLKKIDKKIDQFVKKDHFNVYLPSTKNYLMQYLASHHNCSTLFIMEEGLLTYTNHFLKQGYKTKLEKQKIKGVLRYPKDLHRSLVYINDPEKKNPKLISISKDIYQTGILSEILLLNRLYPPPLSDEYFLNNEVIFFFDGGMNGKFTTLENYTLAINILLKRINFEHNKLYLKFHHTQNEKTRSYVLGALNTLGVDLIIIPDKVSAEAILLNSKNLRVFGCHSSILYYASIWGHTSCSIMDLLNSIDRDFAGNFKKISLPSIFYDRVKMF